MCLFFLSLSSHANRVASCARPHLQVSKYNWRPPSGPGNFGAAKAGKNVSTTCKIISFGCCTHMCHMPHAPCPMPHKGRTQTPQEINTHRIQFDLGGSVFNKLVVYFQAGELTFIEWENKSFTISKCIGIDKLWKFSQQAEEGVAEHSNFIIIGQH